MLDRNTDGPDESVTVDFVVGSDDPAPDGSLIGRIPLRPSRLRPGLRLRLTLAGAAVILGVVALISHGRADIHHPRPAVSRTPSSDNSTRWAPTSLKALAAVHAVFKGSDIVSAHTELLSRKGHVGATLLNRSITARIPIGTLQISVNRAATGADPNTVTRRSDQQMMTFVSTASFRGYAVTATLAQHAARSDPSALLQALANDARLLAI